MGWRNFLKNKLASRESLSLKNRFDWPEWSGALGDLGTLMPLAFALVAFNGFPPARLFFLWGIVYVLSGWFYRVPVSVQPLKAMSVIAISLGFTMELLSSTAFFYGIVLILLSVTGVIRWLQNWFTPALVRGVQLGIGMILAYKAVEMVLMKGFLLNSTAINGFLSIALLGGVVLLLWLFQFRKRIPVVLVLLAGGILFTRFSGISVPETAVAEIPFQLTTPELAFLGLGTVYLIIPQLPLTLGNAIFAASDACHVLWKERSRRVNPTRLGFSIGLSNVFIGLLGGFPICHGAGGIGAHAQFGGRTGGTTIIIGTLLIISGLISSFASLLFYIPVPILGAMLLYDSWRMMTFVQKVPGRFEMGIALLVGILSFATRNLSIALIAGFLAERAYHYYQKRNAVVMKGVEND